MTLREYLLEGICAFEAFRRLGISADNIYFVAETADGCMAVMVREPGRQFVVSIGPAQEDMDAVVKLWTQLATEYNAGRIENFTEHFEKSWVMQHRHDLVTSMALKGFRFSTSNPGNLTLH